MLPLLLKAAQIAIPNKNSVPVANERRFWLGCIGIRNDGTMVSSRNGAVRFSTTVENYQLVPSSHAEGRCLRKLGQYGTLFVARVARETRELKLSRPCFMCQIRIKSFKVDKVYYTIDENHYGIWFPNKDIDKIYEV